MSDAKRSLLGQASRTGATEPEWLSTLGQEVAESPHRDADLLRATLTWCYKAGQAADNDAWELLIHVTQAFMAGRMAHRTDRIGAKALIGEAARRLARAGLIPAHN